MGVGIDIDDPITLHPGFFSWLTRALVASGHEVIIITSRLDSRRTREDLIAWGIEFTNLVTLTAEDIEAHGLDRWKGEVCARLGVDLMLEDDPDVLANLPGSVIAFRGTRGAAAQS